MKRMLKKRQIKFIENELKKEFSSFDSADINSPVGFNEKFSETIGFYKQAF